MARAKKTLNTDLDDSSVNASGIDTSYPDAPENIGGGDDVTYNMGDIQVSDAQEGDDEEFKKASKKMIADADEDGEEDWMDEDLNASDEDIFLDMEEDYDGDNPYREDD